MNKKFVKSELNVKASEELEKQVEEELRQSGEQFDIASVIGRYARGGVCSGSGVRSEQSRADV